ncbi:MAG: heavy metal translocating P-type ATPase [Anaerolineae bacterium]|nr:heavy metal translocating P-type ATPase [Anaerolineae bacterium]
MTSKKTGWKLWNRTKRSRKQKRPANGTVVAVPSVNGTIGTVVSVGEETTMRVQFQIKHWVKGRLRIVIPRLSTDPEYKERLQYRVMATSSAFTVRINSAAESLVVEYDPDEYEPTEMLDEIVICIRDAAHPTMAIEKPKQQDDESEFKINYRKRLGLPAVAFVLGVGTLTGMVLPPLLVGGVIIAAAIPSYKRAWEGIRDERKLNVDFLDSAAITLLTATGSFFPPVLMIGLIESGEIIRDMTARRTARANLDLLDALGNTARVERDGIEIEVPLEEVEEGDVVVVYPGDQIPVDGTVLTGIGLIDQQKLTGESIPVVREQGQDVLAATLVVDGTLRIETRRTGENTRAGVVVGLMKAAPIHDTRMEDYAKKVGDRVVIPTLALGAAVTVASGGMLTRGVSVITMDIGTGVRVSVPTAILSTLTYAARQGILIRSGRAIEQLNKIDTVVFDKTGTLTQGNAGVVGIYTTSRTTLSADEILRLAASAEQGLTHPVAEAITRHAREREVSLVECEEWEYRVGQGVAAGIEGRTVYVGSHRMMAILGYDVSELLAANPDIEASAASQVYVADDQGLLGVILYRDPARPESAEVIRKLLEMGITPYMLSGDMKKVADAVAAELGIEPEHVFAEAFPERKVEVVKALQEKGKTIAFVGDGINDSAALAHASVSVSFAGATDMARETADVVLMDDNLSALITAIEASKRAMRTVHQNVGIVVIPNATGMVLAALMPLSPVIAVVINNGAAIVAEMNGFRPLLGPDGLRSRLPWGKKPAALSAEALALIETQGPAAANGHIVDHLPIEPVYAAASNGSGNGHSVTGNGSLASSLPAEAPVQETNGHNGHNGYNGRDVALEKAAQTA